MEPTKILEMGSRIYQKDMNEAMAQSHSDIQRFYKDSTIFVTGGSGFIGKQLIEKLFRSCEIKKAYVLIRRKKGKSAQERANEILNDCVFDLVRRKKPNFAKCIIPVEGDVTELRLGINESDWKNITEEVNVIFHVAATIKFDEKLKTAVFVNVRGTREAVKLAKDSTKLKCFVHVSTAYCHATELRFGCEIYEQYYKCPVPPDTIIEMAENIDDDRLNTITTRLIKHWPNTYTFTKAIAEDIIRSESENICMAIVRPSIVLCTYGEPEPAWLDRSCVFGPTGFVVGVLLGVIRVIVVNTSKLSFVPVDFVNNATIAAGWDASSRHTNIPAIYHISSTKTGVTFQSTSIPMRTEEIRSLSTPKAIWFNYLIETDNIFLYRLLIWLLHYVPAYIVDGLADLFHIQRPKAMKSLVQVYSKVDKLCEIFQYFLINEWNFNETNLDNLSKRMSETDRQIFKFDITIMDWHYYSMMWILGCRKHIIKDGFELSKKAQRNQKIFKFGNSVVILLYLYLFWLIIKFMFNLF